jgi:hypothetical protein
VAAPHAGGLACDMAECECAAMRVIGNLWRGHLPLGDAFWSWAVLGGLGVNLSTSLAFLWLITIDEPLLAVFVGYGLSLPFNLVATVGVWRAAAQHEGPRIQADLARIAVLVWMGALSLS